MPVIKRNQSKPNEYETLKNALESEWKTPQNDLPEPKIIEEQSNDPRFHYTRLYVIWSKWQNMRQQERSEIIMDAYDATHSREETLRVTIAMGLTPEEATRLGIQ